MLNRVVQGQGASAQISEIIVRGPLPSISHRCQNVFPEPLSNRVVTRKETIRIALAALFWAVVNVASAADQSALGSGLDFFERKIRPVLAERCLECHSQTQGKTKGGLALDTPDGLRKGGDSGPVIVTGNPDKSRLILAIRYKDQDLQMPPKEPLSADQVADFETWVRNGAVLPAASPGTTPSVTTASSRTNHWAFRSPKAPPLPKVKDKKWPRDPIDHYILSELEDRRLTPAPAAEKRTLIRRATFDLTGLPPTPEEIDSFLSDSSPGAFATAIDRLLNSQHFGERWGRHWLDVARYADSNGTENNLPYPNAWRYRDYVVTAFNRDKPFDQFIREQIAGDLLSASSDDERLERIIATGFLMLGPKVLFEPNRNKLVMDIVDEQIDVTTRAFLGLTVGCARCHDHKYDPIPTRDYYALAGIFKSTTSLAANRNGPADAFRPQWLERPLGDAGQAKVLEDHEARLTKLEGERQQVRSQKMAFPGNIDSKQLTGVVVDNLVAEITGNWKESTGSTNFVDRNYLADGNADKGRKSVRFVAELPRSGLYEVLVSYPPFWNRATNVPVTIECAEGARSVTLDQRKTPDVDQIFVSIGRYRFDAGTNAAVTISNKGTKGFVVADAVRFEFIDPASAEMSMRPQSPAMRTPRQPLPELDKLDDEIFDLRAKAPPPMPSAMAVMEGTSVNCQINLRGDPDRLGDEVPRGFIRCASGSRSASTPLAADTSGRLDLAEWIASPANPLTARVMVNRVWLHLFGRGLVGTPDNFGTLSEPPTHPELLDHLAQRFIEQRWSIKRLIRAIMLSSTYQMSAAHNPAAYARDPDNRLLWRMNRRRLEAEALRDAMYAVSSQLDRTIGGSSLLTNAPPMAGVPVPSGIIETNRRSLYLPVIRNNLTDLFQVFDFPDPHVIAGVRHTTSAPTQALFMMNSPFVQTLAGNWAEALLRNATADDAATIKNAYLQALGRPPTSTENTRAQWFLASGGSDAAQPDPGARLAVWRHFCHALLASTEFRYID